MKFLIALAFSVLLSARTDAAPPNFVVVMLDDSGWTDFGCYGSEIETPNIDRFANEGMRFTDCHSAAPNCSPSRAGLLTGRTPSRVGMYSYRPANHPMHLRAEEITVAELLKDAGYRTGHFGKWHLSTLNSEQAQPLEQGFEHSLGTDNNASPTHHNPVNFVRNGEPLGEVSGYSCQIVVDETLTWLDEIDAAPDSDPFFACVWFHEPHTPIGSPPELIEKYQTKFPKLSEKEAAYYANIENVDIAVGRLLNGLEQLNVSDETVVFLTSDNGPLNRFSRQGLRGQKSNVWEGGHRVPGIFRWPGHIEAGSECEVAISGVDYLPTVCELAGIEAPADRTIDGSSIVPLLLGEHDSFHRSTPLYWFFYRLNPSIAFRHEQWSVIAHTNDSQRPKAHGLTADDMPAIKASEITSMQLFNLETDLAQQNDLASSHPEVLEELRQKLAALHASVVAEGHDWEIPDEGNSKAKRKIWESAD